jgi:carbon monoxide dehydrogenase subunit G
VKLEHSFQVNAPLERVWQALVDVERVAPCLPGAEITEAGEDGTYRGTFTVRLGPTTASYRGELAMEEVDDAAHRAVMRASGADKRGQGSAKAKIVSTMREEGDLTTVDVETDFTITGRLARFGRGGMIQDVSNRLLRDFSECLQQMIERAEPTAEPATAEAHASGAAETGTGESKPVSAQPAPLTGEGDAPAAPPARQPAKPVGGLSLLFGALIDRLKRLFKRS